MKQTTGQEAETKADSEDVRISAQPPAIRAENLTKRFSQHEGVVQALGGVSFEVPKDTVFAILGPNGAGKTTLLKILTTVMKPNTGTAWIDGYEIGRQNIEVRQRIGIVAQENHFDKYLSIWDNLVVHAQMHGMSRRDYEKRITELLEKVDLYQRRRDYIEDLSGGMQRRIALIRALVHHPRVLFLDEPTTGLDPSARLEIWETIQQLKRSATIILTTHYMEEADRLSDAILILNGGKVVMEGTPQQLKQMISHPDLYDMHFTSHKASHYLPLLEKMARDVRKTSESTLQFRLDNPEDMAKVMAVVDWADVQSVGVDQADLETVYLTAATGKIALQRGGA